tara:strand:- start:449 stop:1123 length:675 start_codon:yes stop_codon:yes gene_type:complete
MNYSEIQVKKPWGYEYLVYKNHEVALWYLYIKDKHSTSMHCHPNKTTGLILLDGRATVSFMNDSFNLSPISKTMIRKGLFHSTRASSKNGAHVFEIESPVDKHDLVRLEDNYGREGKPYESKEFQKPKEPDSLWLEEPQINSSNEYNFLNCKIYIRKTSNIKDLTLETINDNIVFLDGGISTKEGILVAQPGDVLSNNTLKKLINLFPSLIQNTIYMTISKKLK